MTKLLQILDPAGTLLDDSPLDGERVVELYEAMVIGRV